MKFTNLLYFFGVILAAVILAGCGKKEEAAVSDVNPPVTAVKPDFAKLIGKWLRPDGGYVIEIRGVDAGGKMDASYSNPNPINIGKAEASIDGANMKVFVELRAENYPGSKYNLTYDPGSDRLNGTYYQAVAGETYDIYFVRLKQ